MSNIHSTVQIPRRNPKIDKNNPVQIDTLAKLFRCDFEDVLNAVEQSNGTFISVFQVIKSMS